MIDRVAGKCPGIHVDDDVFYFSLDHFDHRTKEC